MPREGESRPATCIAGVFATPPVVLGNVLGAKQLQSVDAAHRFSVHTSKYNTSSSSDRNSYGKYLVVGHI